MVSNIRNFIKILLFNSNFFFLCVIIIQKYIFKFLDMYYIFIYIIVVITSIKIEFTSIKSKEKH